MLFVVDAAGVPSVAKMVQVAKGPNPVMSPVKNSTGRCVDVPSSATAIRTYLQALQLQQHQGAGADPAAQ